MDDIKIQGDNGTSEQILAAALGTLSYEPHQSPSDIATVLRATVAMIQSGGHLQSAALAPSLLVLSEPMRDLAQMLCAQAVANFHAQSLGRIVDERAISHIRQFAANIGQAKGEALAAGHPDRASVTEDTDSLRQTAVIVIKLARAVDVAPPSSDEGRI